MVPLVLVLLAALASAGTGGEDAAGPRLRLRGSPVGAGTRRPVLELVGGPAGGSAVLFFGPERGPGEPPRVLAGRELRVRPDYSETRALDGLGRLVRPIGTLPSGTAVQALVLPCPRRGGAPGLSNAVGSARVAFGGDPWLGGGETQSGEVLVTEFMKDPTVMSDSNGEWVELYNTTTQPIDIEGWVLGDQGSDQYVIFNRFLGLWIGPGEYLLLGNNDDGATNGGIYVHNETSGFTLSNGADEIELRKADGTLVDLVVYDDGVLWPDEAGRSIQLDPALWDATSNDNPASWCHIDRPIHRGNLDSGTPGGPNEPCGGGGA